MFPSPSTALLLLLVTCYSQYPCLLDRSLLAGLGSRLSRRPRIAGRRRYPLLPVHAQQKIDLAVLAELRERGLDQTDLVLLERALLLLDGLAGAEVITGELHEIADVVHVVALGGHEVLDHLLGQIELLQHRDVLVEDVVQIFLLGIAAFLGRLRLLRRLGVGVELHAELEVGVDLLERSEELALGLLHQVEGVELLLARGDEVEEGREGVPDLSRELGGDADGLQRSRGLGLPELLLERLRGPGDDLERLDLVRDDLALVVLGLHVQVEDLVRGLEHTNELLLARLRELDLVEGRLGGGDEVKELGEDPRDLAHRAFAEGVVGPQVGPHEQAGGGLRELALQVLGLRLREDHRGRLVSRRRLGQPTTSLGRLFAGRSSIDRQGVQGML